MRYEFEISTAKGIFIVDFWVIIPCRAVLANFLMEKFKEVALDPASVVPKVWWRYVEDVFAINKEAEQIPGLSQLTPQT